MLKQLLSIWREDQDPLNEMIQQFEEMLDKGQLMFRSVTDALLLGGDMPAIREETYRQDGELNDLEQTIRRQVVVHLSLGHMADLTPSLILMSVVKDAERLGDYAKNIFQAAEIIAPLNGGALLEPLQEVRNAIISYFSEVKECFVTSDETKARELLRKFGRHGREVDQWVVELLKEPKQENAVAFALLLRFFKRIISHLGNIATSVIMPVDKLDYFDEDHREKIDDL